MFPKELRDGRIQMNNLTKKWCDEVRSGLVEQGASDLDFRQSMSLVETETDHQADHKAKKSQASGKSRKQKRKSRVKLSPKSANRDPSDTDSSDAAFEIKTKD